MPREGAQAQAGPSQPTPAGPRQSPKVPLKPGPGVAAPQTDLSPKKEEWEEPPPTQDMVDEVRASAETLRKQGVAQLVIDQVQQGAARMAEVM